MIITKVINDFSVGEYVAVINYNNSTVTTIINKNVYMYKFDKDIIISVLLDVAPHKDINDFIIDILGDEDLTNECLTELKHM